jgi:hypothetical protein
MSRGHSGRGPLLPRSVANIIWNSCLLRMREYLLDRHLELTHRHGGAGTT